MTFGAVHQTLKPFTPQDLFLGGTDGYWYDASDLNTLFTDAAGTTPVGAAGDVVGYWKDKSGKGHHAPRNVSDTHRPTWNPGTDGRPYLLFAAAAATAFGPTGMLNVLLNAGYATMIIGVRFTVINTGATRVMNFISCNSLGIVRTGMYQDSATTLNIYARRLDADANATLAGPSTLVTDGDYVILGDYNFAERYGLCLMNTAITSNFAGTFPSTTAGSIPTSTADASIGSVATTTNAFPWQGRMYQLIVVNRQLTQGERQKAMRYVAEKTFGRFN